MTYLRSRRLGQTASSDAELAESLGETALSAVPGVGTVAATAVSVISSLVSSGNGSGEPDGSALDPRIIDLNTAYNQALSGDSEPSPAGSGNGTGWYYIQTWINDEPPHPDYSNAYAETLTQILTEAGYAPGFTGTPTIVAQPATSTTSASSPPETAPYTGASASSALPWIVGGVAVVGLGALLLR